MNARRRIFATLLLAALPVAVLQHPLIAMFAQGTDAPVDRLVKNLTEKLRKQPKDARAQYLLARVHALAFSYKTQTLKIFEDQAKSEKFHLDSHMWEEGLEPKEHSKEALQQHLHLGVEGYRKAIELEPCAGLYHLSLASLIESAMDELTELNLEPRVPPNYGASQAEDIEAMLQDIERNHMPDVATSLYLISDLLKLKTHENQVLAAKCKKLIAAVWLEEAIHHYWLAYVLNVKRDLKDGRAHSGVDIPIAHEALTAYIRLVEKRGPTPRERIRIAQMAIDGQAFEAQGRAVTPIIFSLDAPQPLSALLSESKVKFDLDGDDIVDSISWVRPGTCILVWDPAQHGHITSGRQLFGSVTWWLFWDDGYAALAALDDDADGWLSGAELKGLAVWRDENANGVSEPGEVTPLEQTEIAALETTATASVAPGPSPANFRGLRLKNGRSLPTYDWVTEIK